MEMLYYFVILKSVPGVHLHVIYKLFQVLTTSFPFAFPSDSLINPLFCFNLEGVTHIRWGDLKETVSQVCQIAMVTKALYDMVSSLQESDGNRVAHILCGDFNIEPQFPAYKLLAEGKLTDKEINTLKGYDYIRWGRDTYMEKKLQVWGST